MNQWISSMCNPEGLAFKRQVLHQDLQMKELLALLGLAYFGFYFGVFFMLFQKDWLADR